MQNLVIESIIGKRIQDQKLEYLAQTNQGQVWISIKQLKFNLKLVSEYEYTTFLQQRNIIQSLENFDIKIQIDNNPEWLKVKEDQQSIQEQQIQQIQAQQIEVRRRKRYDQFI